MQYTIVSVLALAAAASATTIKVAVGQNGLSYTPSDIKAAPGDEVEFTYFPKVRSPLLQFHFTITNPFFRIIPFPSLPSRSPANPFLVVFSPDSSQLPLQAHPTPLLPLQSRTQSQYGFTADKPLETIARAEW